MHRQANAAFDFPDRKAAESYTHDLVKLVGLAGLKQHVDANSLADRSFELNWSVVKDWAVEDRYNLNISPAETKDLYSAISARQSGVMAWLRRYW